MNDKSLTKVICRIITLLQYIFVGVVLIFEAELIPEMYNIKIINQIFSDIRYPIFICAIPLIIMMIISLIIKYTFKDKSKINPYRITDVITRLIFTIPSALIICYYIFNNTEFLIYIDVLIGIVIFTVLNLIIRFTLQETMDVSFIVHDNL